MACYRDSFLFTASKYRPFQRHGISFSLYHTHKFSLSLSLSTSPALFRFQFILHFPSWFAVSRLLFISEVLFRATVSQSDYTSFTGLLLASCKFCTFQGLITIQLSLCYPHWFNLSPTPQPPFHWLFIFMQFILLPWKSQQQTPPKHCQIPIQHHIWHDRFLILFDMCVEALNRNMTHTPEHLIPCHTVCICPSASVDVPSGDVYMSALDIAGHPRPWMLPYNRTLSFPSGH
jgi:hypothetical protein